MVEPIVSHSNTTVDPVVAPDEESVVVVGFHDRSYVDWSAVFGGVVISLALWMLLTSFGASIGLFVAPPWNSIGSAAVTLTLATAAWFAIVQIFTVATGAYLSGRLRQRVADGPIGEVSFRDGSNGLLVWALGLVFAASIAGLAALGGIAATSAGAVSDTRSTDVDVVIDRMFRPALASGPGEADSAVVTDSPAITIVPRTRRATLDRDEISRILEQGDGASLAPNDRQYLAALVASSTNLDADQAKSRVDETLQYWKAERETTAETARKAGALMGLWTVAVMLLSALAAWWAGALGGRHRDDFV